MKAFEIASDVVYSVPPTAKLNEVASIMKRHGIGAVPVCEGKNLIGMITDRDIVIGCVASGMHPAACQADEFMTSAPIAVNPDTGLEEVAAIMGTEQIRRIPIINDGEIIGVISLGDLASSLLTEDAIIADTLREISNPISI